MNRPILKKVKNSVLEAFDLLRRSVMFHGQSLLSFMLHAGKPGVNSGEKRDFVSSGFTIRPKGGILYPYHSKIQEETMDIRQLHYFLVSARR